MVFADVRQFVNLFNLAGPDFTAQDETSQVVRYSITNGGPPVAVGGTVNTDPRAWVNNCSPKEHSCDGDAALRLSQQVFQQYGQAGYAWDPKMATTPGPQLPASYYEGYTMGNMPAPPGAGRP